MAMDILIIGGSRFSGKQLLLKLARENHNITVINRGLTPFTYPKNVTHITLDRNNYKEMAATLSDRHFDWAFDFIAWRGPETQQIIELLTGKVEKFIHISTVDVYDLNHIQRYPTMPIYELDAVGPITDSEPDYPRGKRLCEKYLLDAYNANGFPCIILRPTYIYGPDNYSYKEAYFFHRIQHQRPLYIQSPRGLYFDMIHAEDMADLCILAAKSPNSIGQMYNASCGEFITSEAIADLVSRWEGKAAKLVYFSSTDLKKLKWPKDHRLWPYEYPISMAFSPNKAIQELGFTPKYRLVDGLKQTYSWFAHLSENEKQEKWRRQIYSKEWEQKLGEYFKIPQS